MIGTRYGCLRCRYAFSVIGGRVALIGDRARDLLNHIEPQAPVSPRRERDEIPLQRDPDMRWDRKR